MVINYNKAIEYLFYSFLIVSLLYTLPFTERNELLSFEESGGGNILRQLFFLSTIAFLLIAYCKKYNKLVFLNPSKYFWLLFIWLLCTLLWSETPGIGFRRLVLTFLCLYSMIYFVSILGFQRSFQILTNCMILLMFASFMAGIFIPAASHLPSDPESSIVGAWRGLFYHKNHAGLVLGVTLIVSIFLLFGNPTKKNLLITFMCSITLVMTESKTSILFSVLSLFIVYVITYIEKKTASIRFASFTSIIFICLILVMALMDSALNYLLTPETLTGRGFVWQIMTDLISIRPIEGYGFGSLFGVGINSPILDVVSTSWAESLPHGHNGYVDVWATTGAIGLVLSVYVLLFRPLIYYTATNSLDIFTRQILLAIFIFLILNNLMESSFLDRVKQGWVLWSYVYAVSLSKLNKVES